MVINYKLLFFSIVLCLLGPVVVAQTYCLKYAPTSNGVTVDITVSLVANGSAFKLGASNLQFKYNKEALSTPILVSNTLAATGRYNGISLTEPTPLSFKGTSDGLVSLNFNFTGSMGTGLPINLVGTAIAVIRFQIKDPGLSPNLRPYDKGSAGTIVYTDDPDNPQLLTTFGNCAIYDNVLPLEWLSMKAYATPGSEQKTVTVDWATASEKNTSHFVVERSQNGQDFDSIGQVKSRNQASEYSFIDIKPFNLLNYYRIRQVDVDGKESTSKIASVSFSHSTTFKLYPTLFTTTHGFLNVEWQSDKSADPLSFQIVNLLGQQVMSGQLATRIDVSDLPQGAYVFTVGLEQAKFVKQ